MHSAAYHTLYPYRYRRAARGKTLGHLVPAAVLASGLGPLVQGTEPLTPLLTIEIVVGLCYLVLMVRELWHLRHPALHHERVAWLELAAAGILALEGYHIWHRHHAHDAATGSHSLHLLPWLYWGLAVVYVGLAFGVARVLERRFLHLHDTGFSGRLHLLKPPFHFEWDDVQAVEANGPTGAVVQLRAGGEPHLLSFAHLHDGAVHRDQLLAHARSNLAAPTAETASTT